MGNRLTDWKLYESLTKENQVFESFAVAQSDKAETPKLHPLLDK